MYKCLLTKSLSAVRSPLLGLLGSEIKFTRSKLCNCIFPARTLIQTLCLHTETQGNRSSSQSITDRAMKYVLVTGGVVSGLGKGVTASSIGVVLKACGLRVTSIKIGFLWLYLPVVLYLCSALASGFTCSILCFFPPNINVDCLSYCNDWNL